MMKLKEMDYQTILNQIHGEVLAGPSEGAVAAYIPELAKVGPAKFGICLCALPGGSFEVGDSEERFSIQSISKVLSLALAFSLVGDRIWDRVGVEPSGNPFNSIIQLELEHGKPRNPLINAGGLVVCDILISELKNPMGDYLAFIQKIAGFAGIKANARVAQSEKQSGHKNMALVHLMKSFGNIENPTEEVLDLYFHQCSIEMSCRELAQTFLLFANHGKLPAGPDGAILTKSQTKRLNSIMQTCGFYDESGEFAFKVGLPGKSGVGGGIAAIHPDKYSVAVWSPRLNKKGNSVRGMKALELLTTKTEQSIF